MVVLETLGRNIVVTVLVLAHVQRKLMRYPPVEIPGGTQILRLTYFVDRKTPPSGLALDLFLGLPVTDELRAVEVDKLVP